MWKLGLDLGTNSIGWAVFTDAHVDAKVSNWEDWDFADGGVRIFSDGRQPQKNGKVGDSNAVVRREARSLRRNLDRGKNRIASLAKALVDLGLLPAERPFLSEGTQPSPYFLRARAVEKGSRLTAHELGRVLLHLGLRRGYLSNRRIDTQGDADPKKEKEETDFKSRIKTLHRALELHCSTIEELNAVPEETPAPSGRRPWTVGEFLWQREQQGLPLRFRGDSGNFFPDRELYAAEVDAVFANQAPHHPVLTKDVCDRLRNHHILFQHPLRPVERGACSFYTNEKRSFRDTPLAHRFRLQKTVATLRYYDAEGKPQPLSVQEQKKVRDKLNTQQSLKFSALCTVLKLPKGTRFNLESDRVKELEGNKLNAKLKKYGLDQLIAEMDLPLCEDIFERLHAPYDGNAVMSDDRLIASLVRDFALSQADARKLAGLPLATETTRLSRKAMDFLLPVMEEAGKDDYQAAVELLGEDKAKERLASFQEEVIRQDRLPYYGQILGGLVMGGRPDCDAQTEPEKHFGRIGNPTVHIALNQLRKLVNDLIARFGECPAHIQVELGRDLKLPKHKRDEINSIISANEKQNKKYADEWKVISGGQEPKPNDLKKMRLWHELAKDEVARRCVFTGRVIRAAHLVNGEVEIEHLLPRSRTLDNSMNNLTLCFKDANYQKQNKTPFEAFGSDLHADKGMVWAEILQRAQTLPPAKARRFLPSAMDDFESDEDFLARQSTDNAYIAKAARRYLTAICQDVVPGFGRLTALLRSEWKLNDLLPSEVGKDGRKNRSDHRHHAIDAFVIGLVTRGIVRQISTARGQNRESIFVPPLPVPLKEALEKRLSSLVVSYRPNHGGQGPMFNETAYGFLSENAKERRDDLFKDYRCVVRKRITDLSMEQIGRIRDEAWREKVRKAVESCTKDKELTDTLQKFSKEHGVKSLRILESGGSVYKIPSAPYKGYAVGEYACCDIWSIPEKKKWTWKGKFWTYADCKNGEVPHPSAGKPHPAARFVMRLFKNDLVATVDEQGKDIIRRVCGYATTSHKLDLRPSRLTDSPQNHIALGTLQKQGLRKVTVSPSGVVRIMRPQKVKEKMA